MPRSPLQPAAPEATATHDAGCTLAKRAATGARGLSLLALIGSLVWASGCGPRSAAVERPEWALAIHGGAGKISRQIPEERRQAYLASLTAVLGEGRDRLARGERALDVVEQLVRRME